MKQRTKGHTETTISGDTRADWLEAFELVPSLQIAYVWHASVRARVADSIFNHAAKAIEIEDIEARVSALEAAAPPGDARR